MEKEIAVPRASNNFNHNYFNEKQNKTNKI